MKIDDLSFQLGMINCFVEMVACGVKRLAISPPLSPEDYVRLEKASEEIVQGFGVKSYLEKSLLITDLQSEEFTRDKWSILYYKRVLSIPIWTSRRRRSNWKAAAATTGPPGRMYRERSCGS